MARNKGEDLVLNMTPMIDVVFQLIIFFVVTVKPIDILAHLDVFRPAPDQPKQKQEDIEMLDIQVFRGAPDRVLLQGQVVTFDRLEKHLTKLAKYDLNQTIVIKCTEDSLHEKLVRVLDTCVKVGLTKLSVFTL